ncbi:hypothetical protein [Aliivibrio fischeri]|uniref:hypothetical protein n=1 Tax=Aliivibrio fischeri TaxID=668 RepID=UPI0012D914FD|nr:hypothetical protein [Aliivibrio fischeri]MUJ20455.1 hypothetical protein [Aliivibrio fischeri]
MTNNELNSCVESWQAFATLHNITLPNGKKLPKKFWGYFLGYSNSAFKKMVGNEKDIRRVKAYTAKHVKLICNLEHDAFIREIQSNIPGYMLDSYA